jgi:hypothetical protein
MLKIRYHAVCPVWDGCFDVVEKKVIGADFGMNTQNYEEAVCFCFGNIPP